MNYGLNEKQLEAVNSDASCILCLAGAGCGKTKTIITRAARLVKDGVDPASILVLTFTNAAAFEMKDRYEKLNAEINPGASCPEFRTFHSFCYSLIIKNKDVRMKLGYEKIPQICSDTDLKFIKTELIQKLGVKLSEKEIAKGVSYDREKQRQLELFDKALKKELRRQNLVTFDIMCYDVCQLFVDNDKSILCYKDRYKHLIVDEMQDTDNEQFKFVNSFGRKANYFFCADALQCIYQFRGCTNAYVKTLAEDPNWKLIKLKENYRSTNQICEYANKFSRYAKNSYRIEMCGSRDGAQVETISGACALYDSPVDKRHLSILIKKLQDNPEETGILCRTNKEVNAVGDYLKSAGIDYVRSSKETDTLHLLNSALDNNYMKEWLSTFLDSKEYADYVRLCTLNEDGDIHWFLSMYGNKDSIKTKANKIGKIRREVSAKGVSVADKVANIKKILKVKASKEFSVPEDATNRQIVETLRDQVLEDEESKIYIGTIHSAKGLEYDRVCVMGVDDKSFELGTEEMNNLFYVAVTRAREHLIIFRA